MKYPANAHPTARLQEQPTSAFSAPPRETSNLPHGWISVRLAEIATLNPRHPREFDPNLPVSFIPMPAVSESSPVLDASRERPFGEVRTGYTHFADGDVLFAKITPCMENGKGAVARGLRNGLGCGTTELHGIRPHPAVLPDYLYRFLAQQSVRSAAKENFTGTAGQARVPISFLEELQIPLPPTAEQHRIVSKLETLLAKVDACQQRLAKIPRLLKRFRQAVLAAACSGRLTADWRENRGSEEWRSVTISEVLSGSFYGPRFGAADYSDEGVPTIRTTDMDFRGGISLAESPRVKLTLEQLRHFGLQNGDLVVTRTGGYDRQVRPLPRCNGASHTKRIPDSLPPKQNGDRTALCTHLLHVTIRARPVARRKHRGGSTKCKCNRNCCVHT